MLNQFQHELFICNPAKTLNILMHGFDSSMTSTSVSLLFERLRAENQNVFRFSFRGHGTSEGKLEDTSLDTQIKDLKRVIKFFKSNGFKSFNLFGSSFSGQVSLFCAEKDKSIKKIFLKCPLIDGYSHFLDTIGEDNINKVYQTNTFIYNRFNGEKLKLTADFILSFRKHRFENLNNIYEKEIIVVHGIKDLVVPLGHIEPLLKKIPSENFLLLKNSGHRIQGSELEMLIEFYLKFLD